MSSTELTVRLERTRYSRQAKEHVKPVLEEVYMVHLQDEGRLAVVQLVRLDRSAQRKR